MKWGTTSCSDDVPYTMTAFGKAKFISLGMFFFLSLNLFTTRNITILTWRVSFSGNHSNIYHLFLQFWFEEFLVHFRNTARRTLSNMKVKFKFCHGILLHFAIYFFNLWKQWLLCSLEVKCLFNMHSPTRSPRFFHCSFQIVHFFRKDAEGHWQAVVVEDGCLGASLTTTILQTYVVQYWWHWWPQVLTKWKSRNEIYRWNW